MRLEDIEEIVKKRIPRPLDVKYKFSVLVPLIERNGELELLYELRAKDLKRQPGEISFPGGEVEDGESFRNAAIRETCEELNVKEGNIRIVGQLDYLISYSNSSIYPYLGVLKGIDLENINYNKDEVDHIFTVPLKFFLEKEPKEYYIGLETMIGSNFPYDKIPYGEKYNWQKGRYSVYFYEYNNYIIWGITAKITKNFIDIIKKLI